MISNHDYESRDYSSVSAPNFSYVLIQSQFSVSMRWLYLISFMWKQKWRLH